MSLVKYGSDFGATENPISDSSQWTNGLATGLDWTDVQTASGLAKATQDTNAGGSFNDSIAHLAGFPADVRAVGVIKLGTTNNNHEVELLLRFKIAGHSARGYECNIAWDGAYSQVMRWNGALGSFDQVHSQAVTAPTDRAIFSAEIIGNIIEMFLNGTSLFTADITSLGSGSVWTDGDPGMGYFRHTLGSVGAQDQFCLYSYKAADINTSCLRLRGGVNLQSTTLPTLSGDWCLGFWLRCNEQEYTGASGEHVPFYMGRGVGGAGTEGGIAMDIGNSGSANPQTILTALMYSNTAGANVFDVLTSSDTRWIYCSFQHASGSTNYTFRWRFLGDTTFSSHTLTNGVQFGAAAGTPRISFGTSQASEDARDSSVRSFFCQQTTLTDAQLLVASRYLDAAPAGTNLHACPLKTKSTATTNNGTAGAWTLAAGTLITDADSPIESFNPASLNYPQRAAMQSLLTQ